MMSAPPQWQTFLSEGQGDLRCYYKQGPGSADRFQETWRSLAYDGCSNAELLGILRWSSRHLRKSYNYPGLDETLAFVLNEALDALAGRELQDYERARIFYLMRRRQIDFDKPAFIDDFCDDLDPDGPDACQHISYFFCAAAQTGFSFDVNKLRQLATCYRNKIGTVESPGELTSLFKAVTILGLRGTRLDFSPLLSALERRLLQLPLARFSAKDKCRLFDAQTASGAMTVYFCRVADSLNVKQSIIERKFLGYLCLAGAVYRPKDGFVPGMHHYIDIPVSWRDGLVLGELDGPSHFAWKPGRNGLVKTGYDGATLLQSALLQRFLPHEAIVRVDYSDRKMLTATSETTRAFLDSVLSLDPGVYGTQQFSFFRVLPNAPVYDPCANAAPQVLIS